LDENQQQTEVKRLVYFAAERTFLSWIRASVALMIMGFVVDRFSLFLQRMFPQSGKIIGEGYFSLWFGTTLVGLGSIMLMMATVRYILFVVRYRRTGSTDPGPGLPLTILFAVLVIIAGILLFLSLIILAN
jgi:putative membrane protein